MDMTVSIPVAKVVSEIMLKPTAAGGEMLSFVFQFGKEKLLAYCFQEDFAFKRIRESMVIERGVYITMNCTLSFYHKNLVSDEKWKGLSSERNPTGCILTRFRIDKIDYAIPLEIHNKLKTVQGKKEPVKPIGDLSRFES